MTLASRKTIDINADVGESWYDRLVGADSELIPLVSSINIACGFHGGDPLTLLRAIQIGLDHGVQIGAHPSYRDPEGFGRTTQPISPEMLEAEIAYQLSALQGLVQLQGGVLRHVKPHGALYHQVAEDPSSAKAVLRGIRSICPQAQVVGTAGSLFCEMAPSFGLEAVYEAFADRRYRLNKMNGENGTLVPRGDPNALIVKPQEVANQALEIVLNGTVTSVDGKKIKVQADTLCLHGDHPGAVESARALCSALDQAGVELHPFSRPESPGPRKRTEP